MLLGRKKVFKNIANNYKFFVYSVILYFVFTEFIYKNILKGEFIMEEKQLASKRWKKLIPLVFITYSTFPPVKVGQIL